MIPLNSICVFCGSSTGENPVYKQKAIALGKTLAENQIELIYGGGNIGLMGIIANTVLKYGGKVTGVLPQFLNKKEVGHVELSTLILVNSMHDRKQKMNDLADGFIAMPGGLGTLEEVAEVLTWVQLGLIAKPVGFYNIKGYFKNLLDQLDYMVGEGFMKQKDRQMINQNEEAEELILQMRNYKPILVNKWLKEDQT